MTDALAQAVLLHADNALRQLPFTTQQAVVDELNRRIEARQSLAVNSGGLIRCRDKRRYETEAIAVEALRRHRNKGSLETYACHDCNGWHIGHRRA